MSHPQVQLLCHRSAILFLLWLLRPRRVLLLVGASLLCITNQSGTITALQRKGLVEYPADTLAFLPERRVLVRQAPVEIRKGTK